MPELSQEQINKIDAGMDRLIKLETVLLGANGDTGLVGKVEDACDKFDNLENAHNKLVDRVSRIEVKSGFIALLISAVAAIASWLANR